MDKTGINKIHNKDCQKLLQNQKYFPDDSVDLIFTSPPYSDKRKDSYGGIHPNKYVKWFLPISEQLHRVLKPKGSFIMNIKEGARSGQRETYVLELILEMKKQGWLWIEEYCWYKKTSFPGKWHNRFRDSFERCLHFTKQKRFKMYQDSVKVPIGDWAKKRFKSMTKNDFIRYTSKTNNHLGRNVSNWLKRKRVFPHNVIVFEEEHYDKQPSNVIDEIANYAQNGIHSATFPIELPTWFIKLFTQKNNLVLDPFSGVGTTCQAALLLERKYIGIEILSKFVNEANKNLEEVNKLKK